MFVSPHANRANVEYWFRSCSHAHALADRDDRRSRWLTFDTDSTTLDPDELYWGGRIESLKEWAAATPGGLNDQELESLEISAPERDAEAAALAEFGGLIARVSSLPEQDLQLVMLVAVEAFDIKGRTDSRGALQAVLTAEARFAGRVLSLGDAGLPTHPPTDVRSASNSRLLSCTTGPIPVACSGRALLAEVLLHPVVAGQRGWHRAEDLFGGHCTIVVKRTDCRRPPCDGLASRKPSPFGIWNSVGPDGQPGTLVLDIGGKPFEVDGIAFEDLVE
jgi:hypothetical protein